ncbi:MAG: DUF5596 domain-containing protein [Clostridia bacterium]|nr:DUF5596 domain-containing protein [Clostridia bacterium]
MKKIIEKWFDILQFPTEWKGEILESAQGFSTDEIEKNEQPYEWLFEQENKLQGLLYALYKCEDFFNTGRKRNIPEDILIKTLSEVRRYALEYYTSTGKIGVLMITWLGIILNGNIYRLGRLEFEMHPAQHSCEELGLEKGENVIGVHIPDNGGPFTPEACEKAYAIAKDFFAEYFPEYSYTHYVCESWLLDTTLKNFLNNDSNIVKFMDTFKPVVSKEAYSALIYLFSRDTSVEDLGKITPKTSLQKAVIDHIQNGGKLYTTFGVKIR